MQLVVFRLDRHHYAIPLTVVDRIVQAVEVTPLPGAPAIVMGVINIEGRMVPVLNIRRRFLLPERAIGLSDQFLIARAGGREVALVIDEAESVVERPQSAVTDPAQLAPGVEQFEGAIELDEGLVLIHDVQKFLSMDETRDLDEADPPDA